MFFKTVLPLLAFIAAAASAGVLVGGPIDADMNEESVQNALQFAVAKYNRESNDAFVRQVSDVLKVQKQLVSGMKYIFTVNMGRTNCRKSGTETLCAIHEDPSFARITECKIVVWSQPWINSIKVLENTCP